MGKGDDRVGAGTTRNEMNLIYLLDTSGSMFGEPINQLNAAMTEAVNAAEEAALENEAELRMRVIEFNTSAHWLIGSKENGVPHIDWEPLKADGGTDTAGAIDLATGVMHRIYLGERNYKPVVILITDGESNNPEETVAAVKRLKSSLVSSKDPHKDKIIRIAIGVDGANRRELENFASIGVIDYPDGRSEENVPLVFDVSKIDLLKSLVKGVTVSSIASALGGGLDGEEDDLAHITPGPDDDDDDDWEE